MASDTFGSRATLRVGDASYEISRLDALAREGVGHVERLPFSLKLLLENLLRREDGESVTADDIRALADWTPGAGGEVAFMPARVLHQDLTGVPTMVDMAAMRDAMRALGGDPKLINPIQPGDLVIGGIAPVVAQRLAILFDLRGAPVDVKAEHGCAHQVEPILAAELECFR